MRYEEIKTYDKRCDSHPDHQTGIVTSDGLWLAKDRSGKLGAWEGPDLSAVIAKIGGNA